jgi:hypothetical protein
MDARSLRARVDELTGDAVPTLVGNISAGSGKSGSELLIGIPDTPEMWGAKGDGIALRDAAITSGTNVLSSASRAFTAADVGKLVVVWGAAANVTSAEGESVPGTLASSIASISGSNAVLAANAAVTVTGATAIFGTDDTAALNACYLANAAAVPEVGGGTAGDAGPGLVRHRSARYCISGEVVIPGQGDIIGTGIRNTHFECMTAAAGMRWAGRGTLSSAFNIHGNWIAPWPWSIGKQDGTQACAQRHFDSFEVKFAGIIAGTYTREGLWGGLLYTGNAQNCLFTNMELGYSYSDGYVNDLGAATNRAKGYEIEAVAGWHVKFTRSAPIGQPVDNTMDAGVVERAGRNFDGHGLGGFYIGSGSLKVTNTSVAVASTSSSIGGLVSDATWPNPNPNLTHHMMTALVEKQATASQAILSTDKTTLTGNNTGQTCFAIGDVGVLKIGVDVSLNAFQVGIYAGNTATIIGADRLSVNGTVQTWSNGTGDTTTGSASILNCTQPFQQGDAITGTGIPAGTVATSITGGAGAWTVGISAKATATNTGTALTRSPSKGLYAGNRLVNAQAIPPALGLLQPPTATTDLGEVASLTDTQVDALINRTINSPFAGTKLSGIASAMESGSPVLLLRRLSGWQRFYPGRGGIMEGVVFPAASSTPVPVSVAAPSAANRAKGTRVLIPKNGTLVDLYIYIGAAAGNIIGAVLDTGDALAGTHTQLWAGGTTAVGSTGWLKLGDPNLAVTAGQQLDLVAVPDTITTLTLGRAFVAPAATAIKLPTGFLPSAGAATPILSWFKDVGSFAAPGSVTEASISNDGTVTTLIARVA